MPTYAINVDTGNEAHVAHLINEDAEKASNGFRRDAQEVKEYDCLLREIPQEYWIQ